MALLLVGALAAALWPPPMPEPRVVDWEAQAGGPVDARSVIWVGHSLVNQRDPHVTDGFDLMEAVGELARSAGLSYRSLDHTLFGSPLSLLWRGRPHSYDRPEPAILDRLEALRRDVERFDTMVLTEGLPVERSMHVEHSAFYAQRFYCELVRRSPDARVYVYETWSHLHASDPEGDYPAPSTFDWSDRLQADRAHWERIADLAGTGEVPKPGLFGALRTRFGEPAGCEPRAPIFLVPVGTFMRTLSEQLAADPLPYGDTQLSMSHLFANAYESWPPGWPLDVALPPAAERAALEALRLHHTDEPLDDIHSSGLGIYLTALVHYAVLYRRSPVGLPAPLPLPDVTNRRLQELVWEVVQSEPRTGVR